ncbi:MAG: nitrilase-related carbon-nitrogen hydrolase, partial [Planctomycetota bacterium]
MKIGIFQFSPRFGQVTENIKRVTSAIGRKKMNILILPELFSTGYLFASRNELARFSEPIPDGQTTIELLTLSKKTGITIVAGLPER